MSLIVLSFWLWFTRHLLYIQQLIQYSIYILPLKITIFTEYSHLPRECNDLNISHAHTLMCKALTLAARPIKRCSCESRKDTSLVFKSLAFVSESVISLLWIRPITQKTRGYRVKHWTLNWPQSVCHAVQVQQSDHTLTPAEDAGKLSEGIHLRATSTHEI